MPLDVLELVRSEGEKLARFVDERAEHLRRACARRGLDPSQARVAVMTGGGKDSTLALFFAAAIAEMTGCGVLAISMVHPGLSPGTRRNIEATVQALGVQHEWRQFRDRLVSPEGGDGQSDPWIDLYKLLFEATGRTPRFMCVGCNFGSVVTEYSGLVENGCQFLVTGNPPQELAEFERWAEDLKAEFRGLVEFPELTHSPMLDSYRLWWSLYDALLNELQEVSRETPFAGHMRFRREQYLYDFPHDGSPVAAVEMMPVLDADYRPEERQALLRKLGWVLPADIQGGTESDCSMPSAIAAIHVAQHGMADYLVQLGKAADALNPTEEMYSRALAWAADGKSVRTGEKFLGRLGIRPSDLTEKKPGMPLAKALASQLLSVR